MHLITILWFLCFTWVFAFAATLYFHYFHTVWRKLLYFLLQCIHLTTLVTRYSADYILYQNQGRTFSKEFNFLNIRLRKRDQSTHSIQFMHTYKYVYHLLLLWYLTFNISYFKTFTRVWLLATFHNLVSLSQTFNTSGESWFSLSRKVFWKVKSS